MQRSNPLNLEKLQRRPCGFQFFRVSAKLRVRDHDINPGIIQQVSQLGGLEKIIDRHHHGTGLQNTEHSHDKLRAVFQPQANTVAQLHAKMVLQMRRKLE